MARARPDLSTKLIHLCKGDVVNEAFGSLMAILSQRRLKGGSGKIKGGFTCVCFTEAPLAQLAFSLAANASPDFKYRALGLMFDKSWVFEQGARPVIYQTDEEFDQLPEQLRYRHVRYDAKIDFTWEREWRLHSDELVFTPADATLIVPDRDWADLLIKDHCKKQRTNLDAQKITDFIPYPWHIVALADLGLELSDELFKVLEGKTQ